VILDVHRAKVDSRYPLLVSFETEPHDTTNDVSVDKDEERVVHDLHESLVFNSDGHVANLLKNLPQTKYFQQLHYICEQEVIRTL